MANERIAGSVGRMAANRREDVVIVQSLLSKRGFRLGRVDGICGPKTVSAIASFQGRFLRHPDGRIDVGGTTWKQLASDAVPAGAAIAPDTKLTTLLPKPPPDSLNRGLTAVTNAGMTGLLGSPRESFSADCQPPTNQVLKKNFVTKRVARFSVTGLAPAVASLEQVLAEIKTTYPDVHGALGTAGMLCCRYQRGSTTRISNHSWGTAIDLTLNNVLDQRGDNRVQYGLTLIAPIFNKYGWYWGAAFPTEDAMHFEGGLMAVKEWRTKLA